MALYFCVSGVNGLLLDILVAEKYLSRKIEKYDEFEILYFFYWFSIFKFMVFLYNRMQMRGKTARIVVSDGCVV